MYATYQPNVFHSLLVLSQLIYHYAGIMCLEAEWSHYGVVHSGPALQQPKMLLTTEVSLLRERTFLCMFCYSRDHK